MAKINRTVNGKRLTKVIALHRTVQDRLDEIALEKAYEAQALLAEHRYEGDAKITVDDGKVDRYVALDDTAGLKAAMTIEYGRRPNENGEGGMEGLYILHRTFGLRRD